jgi:hypothetical protein
MARDPLALSRLFDWMEAAAVFLVAEVVFVAVGMVLAPVARFVITFAFYFLSTPPPRGPTPDEIKLEDSLIAVFTFPILALIGSVVAALCAVLWLWSIRGRIGIKRPAVDGVNPPPPRAECEGD